MDLKKSLGQHFLIDDIVLNNIAEKIKELGTMQTLLEVGPGMGALTKYLYRLDFKDYFLIEKDDRFAEHLPKLFPELRGNMFHQDVLDFDLSSLGENEITLVGNYPYNISNLIMFWILENKKKVLNSVGMFQKEVAKRIASKHKSKEYGVLSVLVQSIYEVEYLFDISPTSFDPTPKVVSGVISMKRRSKPLADYHKLKKLVKMAFNQRRKMMSNSIKNLQFSDMNFFEKYKTLRPEQVSVEEFSELSEYVII